MFDRATIRLGIGPHSSFFLHFQPAAQSSSDSDDKLPASEAAKRKHKREPSSSRWLTGSKLPRRMPPQ